MNRLVSRFAQIAGLVLMAGTASAQTSPYAVPAELAGTVRQVFPAQRAILMENGTVLLATSPAQLVGVAAGSVVRITYVDKGDRKEIENIQPIAQ